jgi:hypothetical protein
MKWGWLGLWVVAEFTGLVEQNAFISRLSLVALILGSWSAEEAADSRFATIKHQVMKWGWIALWPVAEMTGWVHDTNFISRLSLIALILSSWSAEEAAITADRQANNGDDTATDPDSDGKRWTPASGEVDP